MPARDAAAAGSPSPVAPPTDAPPGSPPHDASDLDESMASQGATPMKPGAPVSSPPGSPDSYGDDDYEEEFDDESPIKLT